jgi:hypothetical protein
MHRSARGPCRSIARIPRNPSSPLRLLILFLVVIHSATAIMQPAEQFHR